MESEWPEGIRMEVDEEGTHAEFEILYEKLPDGCFTCHEVGHNAKFYPQTTKCKHASEEVLGEVLAEANKSVDETADTLESEKDEEAAPIPDSQPANTTFHPDHRVNTVFTNNIFEALAGDNLGIDEEETEEGKEPITKNEIANDFDLNEAIRGDRSPTTANQDGLPAQDVSQQEGPPVEIPPSYGDQHPTKARESRDGGRRGKLARRSSVIEEPTRETEIEAQNPGNKAVEQTGKIHNKYLLEVTGPKSTQSISPKVLARNKKKNKSK
ncbi:hypothetical protein R1flu_027423 [Riccia fluitans]|uniref:Uncharacterized protein n=1 Tax=Riccia fluitans TaxID=41844 RepID=A0ABD1XIV4_9MARC